MVEELKSDVVLVDEFSDPVVIKQDDYNEVRDLQVLTDNLLKYRQEIGRLFQALGNLTEKTNETEVACAEKRRSLVAKYNLDKSPGQWAVDFEKKVFIKIDKSAPVIP